MHYQYPYNNSCRNTPFCDQSHQYDDLSSGRRRSELNRSLIWSVGLHWIAPAAKLRHVWWLAKVAKYRDKAWGEIRTHTWFLSGKGGVCVGGGSPPFLLQLSGKSRHVACHRLSPLVCIDTVQRVWGRTSQSVCLCLIIHNRTHFWPDIAIYICVLETLRPKLLKAYWSLLSYFYLFTLI